MLCASIKNSPGVNSGKYCRTVRRNLRGARRARKARGALLAGAVVPEHERGELGLANEAIGPPGALLLPRAALDREREGYCEELPKGRVLK